MAALLAMPLAQKCGKEGVRWLGCSGVDQKRLNEHRDNIFPDFWM